MENFTREHQRYYIFVEWKNGTSIADIHKKLRVAEGDKSLSKSTIYRWIESFELGQQTIKDEIRSGRPHEAVTPETIGRVEDFIDENPHITTRELAEEVGISRERVEHIIHEELDMRKICKKWIPHVLTDENRRKRVEVSKQLLQILESGFKNIITGDETWIHFYTVPSKESNKVWLKYGENRPQIARTAQNSKKRMFCIFFSAEGIVARILVPKGSTVTGNLYANDILPEVFSNFMRMNDRKTVRNVLLHYDNAAPHTSKIVISYLEQEKVNVLPHPPYSPDLAPCDFFLFPKIKKELKNKKFESVENLARVVQAITFGIEKEEYHRAFEDWRRRLQLCIDKDGHYFEGMK
jgi:[histone H3]-lysine36 N-dimethyltransferase SETMAR